MYDYYQCNYSYASYPAYSSFHFPTLCFFVAFLWLSRGRDFFGFSHPQVSVWPRHQEPFGQTHCMLLYIDPVPKQSMYGTFPYIYHNNQPFM